MTKDPQRLTDFGFKQMYALNHKELVPFISEYLFKKNIFTIGLLTLIILLICLLMGAAVTFLISNEGSLTTILKYICYGIFLTLLLILPHELLHGIAYRICGAVNVIYKANWRKMYFMAVADMFITNRKQFYFIALLPITVITIVMLILTFFTEPGIRIMWLSVATVHASMCIGDIGLLSFFEENKNVEIVTYDDVENEMSYFYSR